jgi:hypothetical protein
MGTVTDDQGLEEIPVLVELEVQQWVDEALRNAARATERILDRIASLGVRRPDQGCGEASDLDLADSKAAQTVMRAVTAYPLNDMQLERIVKLALGRRVLEVTAATTGRDPPGVTTSAVRTASSPRTRPEVMSEDGSESHRTDSTEPEESSSANKATRPTTPSSGGAAAERCPPRSSRSGVHRMRQRLRSRTGRRGAEQLGRLPGQLQRPAARHRPRVASRDLRRRSRGSVQCLAAREDMPPATARPSWT